MEVIPDEAVEAAMAAFAQALDLQPHTPELIQAAWREQMTLALEAAAPHLTERAYNAGHLDGMTGAPNSNPYRTNE